MEIDAIRFIIITKNKNYIENKCIKSFKPTSQMKVENLSSIRNLSSSFLPHAFTMSDWKKSDEIHKKY